METIIKTCLILLLALPIILFGVQMFRINHEIDKFEKALDNIKKPCPRCGETLNRGHSEYTFWEECKSCGYDRFVG